MASPVSIGDAYLMGRLAFRLGHTFSKGRKSAPAEFREVENQLYSLSAALCALEDANAAEDASISIETSRLPRILQKRHADGDDIVRSMLRNCEETLKHLEAIVEKYGCIGKPRDHEEPRVKRWSRELKDNWKKIAWTTEGGDLATLRSQLTVHSNSLNLVLGVLINSQTVKLDDRVEQVTAMLKEIHVWFVENLKDTPSTTGNRIPGQQSNSASDNFCFQLYVESDQAPNLLCKRAGLHPEWKDYLKYSNVTETGSTAQKHLFICQCSNHSSHAESHQTNIASYGLSSLSFSVRLTGKERAWMLYKATDETNHRLISIIIKGVPSSMMAEFEETFIHHLSIIQTREMIRRNLNTMLAYVIPGGPHGSLEARVLNLVGSDMNKIQKLAENVTFTANGQSYVRNSIDSIQLLHYKSLDCARILSDRAMPRTGLSCLDSSEIVVFYEQEDSPSVDGDISRHILHLKHDTRMRYHLGDTIVLLNGIDCTGLDADEQGSFMPGNDVAFQFTSTEAASQFQMRLKEMRLELHIMNMQYPRTDERTILKIQARHVHTEDIHIPDAEVSIVHNTKTQRLRLIIVSQNGCSILSQELSSDFLLPKPTPTTTISSRITNIHPKFTSPTDLIQITGTGKREIYQFSQGFTYLNFEDVQTCRLFELGLAAIAGSPSLKISGSGED